MIRFKYLIPVALVAVALGMGIGSAIRVKTPSLAPSPRYPTTTFGDTSLRVELATTTAVQERGLGGRAVVPDQYGMLFVFPKDDRYGFWMKGMRVPIDIFWLDDKGQVVTIAQNVATSTYPSVFYPTAPARYVLETKAGFASEYGIATGTSLQLSNFENISK